MRLDLATRPGKGDTSYVDDDAEASEADVPEREFLLGLAPSALSVGLLAGALVGLLCRHYLRQHCAHEAGALAHVRCYDTCFVDCTSS